MAAVFIDNPGAMVILDRCTIAGPGVGVEAKRAHDLKVFGSSFYGQDGPIVFDGGGDISIENNRWSRSTEDLERRASPVLIYSPRAIQWMIARIVERHFDR